jgi:cytidylate kinase
MAVITISRQFGAGGKTVGKMIADKLGYTFADDDIIQMVAEAANVSPHWVESIEKEAGGKLSRVVSSMVSNAWWTAFSKMNAVIWTKGFIWTTSS